MIDKADEKKFSKFYINQKWNSNEDVQRILSKLRLYTLNKEEIRILENAIKIILVQDAYLEFKLREINPKIFEKTKEEKDKFIQDCINLMNKKR